MGLTAPSSTLTGQTIAASYDQVLFLDAAAGVTEATLKIVSGTAGKTALSISDEHVLVKGVDTNNAAGFAVHQTDGTAVFTVNASSPAFTLTGNATITTADNTDTLKLISTDADASVGPSLNFYRNSGSPADNDNIGILKATGRNDNSQDVDYVLNYNSIGDASDGTEDGRFETYVMLAGTARSRVKMDETETIFNNDSVDLDFRVESDNNANALFVQGSDGNVGIGQATPQTDNSTARFLHIGDSGDATSGLVIEDNEAQWEIQNNGHLRVIHGSTPRVEFNSAGNLTVENGNLDFGTAGKGVSFSSTNTPAQSQGSGSSNLLDDYEEGTWSPAINYQNGTNNGNATNNTQTGTYTKIGNRVFWTLYLDWSLTGTAINDNINVQGFPFTSLNQAELTSPASAQVSGTSLSVDHVITVAVGLNSTTAGLQATGGNTGANMGDEFGANNNMTVRAQGCYGV